MVKRVLSGLAVAAVAFGAGCEQDCNDVEPAYAGDATDEAWRALVDGRDTATNGDDAPTFSAPDDGGTFGADDNPTFSWDSPLKVATLTPPSTPREGVRRRGLAPFERLSALFIPAAHAHLPPITSDIYLLEVDVPGRTCPVAGITTGLSFSFASSDWEAIVAGGGARSARLLSAFLTENRITEGAFVSAPLEFDVEE